jgi:hypothetical protein
MALSAHLACTRALHCDYKRSDTASTPAVRAMRILYCTDMHTGPASVCRTLYKAAPLYTPENSMQKHGTKAGHYHRLQKGRPQNCDDAYTD